MIDGYTALGEVRVSSTAQRVAREEGRGGGDGGERGAAAMEAGLPRLYQVHAQVAGVGVYWGTGRRGHSSSPSDLPLCLDVLNSNPFVELFKGRICVAAHAIGHIYRKCSGDLPANH